MGCILTPFKTSGINQHLSGPYRAMRAAMRCERRCGANPEVAMRCDAKILAMRILAAEILCDALPRCKNTSDAMPRCRPLRSGLLWAACLQNETAPEKHLNRYEKRFDAPEKHLNRYEKRFEKHVKRSEKIGNGPNTVSGSTLSNTELSESFSAH